MRIILKILGFIWSLPVTLFGLIYAGFLGPLDGELRGGVLWIRCERVPFGFVAQTFGHVVVFHEGGISDTTQRHELVHVAQCDLFGPLVILVYPLCSLVSWLRGTGWYYGNYLEAQARAKSHAAVAQ